MLNLSQPINWNHPLNRGLVHWFKVLPNDKSLLIKSLVNRESALLANGGYHSGIRPSGSYGSWFFDGTDDSIDFGSISSVYSLTQLTVSLWVRKNSTGARTDILGMWKDGATQKFLVTYEIPTSGKFGFYVSIGSGATGTSATTTVNANQWYYVTCTYDGSNAAIYVNGVLEGSSSPGITLYTGSSSIFAIAKSDGAPCIGGHVDDVRVYNRALTANQVSALYLESITGYRSAMNYYDDDFVYSTGGGSSFKAAWARGSNVLIRSMAI